MIRSVPMNNNNTDITRMFTTGSIGWTIARVRRNDPCLTTIDLRYERITDNNNDSSLVLSELANALRSNTVVTTIDMESNFISDRSIQQFVTILMDVSSSSSSSSSSKVTTLNFGKNRITDHGGIVFGQLLQSPNCTIEDLNLNYNPIGSNGIQSIAEALRTNTSLRTLHIPITWMKNNYNSNTTNDTTTSNGLDVLLHTLEYYNDTIEHIVIGSSCTKLLVTSNPKLYCKLQKNSTANRSQSYQNTDRANEITTTTL